MDIDKRGGGEEGRRKSRGFEVGEGEEEGVGVVMGMERGEEEMLGVGGDGGCRGGGR